MTYSHINTLLLNRTKNVASLSLAGLVIRRESVRIDDRILYRFTANTGLYNEFSTFWSTDEGLVLSLIMRRIL